MAGADAVVIGSGPNGLVAANLLADAGWDVLVLEAGPQPGGAVHSSDDVAPGYVHDTFSSFYPLAAVSPTIRGLALERHGLTWVHAPAVVGNPLPGGEWAMLHREPDDTAAALDALAPGDGDAWLAMCREWEQIGDEVVGALLTPFPPVRHGLGALARLRSVGGLEFVRSLVSPVRTLAGTRFRGEGARLLLTGNAAHTDISVDAPGSGVMGWLLAMVGQHLGFPVPRGGAGALSGAMARRLESGGGSVRCSTRVTEVLVEGGRAVGVRTEHGEEVRARRAVVADVSAPALYGGLVPWEHLPPGWPERMRQFVWDPGTIKVDWALDAPAPWTGAPERVPGTVHIAESSDVLSIMQAQISSGLVPDTPFLLVGQMAAADPTRAPAGAESMWAYTHVPQEVTGDAGGDGIRGTWDHDDTERLADRMQARIERFAPGFSEHVRARRVLGPRELEERDENLVTGALNGGTSNLHQQLVFRPVAGLGRAETPVRGLYLGSASAHPGGGVHGACGSNAARAALAHDRAGRVLAAPARLAAGRRGTVQR